MRYHLFAYTMPLHIICWLESRYDDGRWAKYVQVLGTKGISGKSKKIIDILHGKGAATTVKVLTQHGVLRDMTLVERLLVIS